MIYFSGFNGSSIFQSETRSSKPNTETFTKINMEDVTDAEIGWNFLLLKKENELFIAGKISEKEAAVKLLQMPENCVSSHTMCTGKDEVLLVNNDCIWTYNVYTNTWRRSAKFASLNESESIVKIVHGNCTFALTNLGRLFSVPVPIDMDQTKFVDLAAGFEHILLLTDAGEVFSMGIGSRGQLGHGDLENSDEPKLVEALAGVKIKEISACGWHNAVVSEQGDLYTWGWNTDGQLGVQGQCHGPKVIATPQVIDLTENGAILELNVAKVQCGNNFTVCRTENGEFWGCGSNKFGQLGQSQFQSTTSFVKLNVNFDPRSVRHFKCREWGTLLIT